MSVSKAQIKATTKYESANYDKILIRLPKGQRTAIKAAADATGESLNGYILEAVRRRMGQEQPAGGSSNKE